MGTSLELFYRHLRPTPFQGSFRALSFLPGCSFLRYLYIYFSILSDLCPNLTLLRKFPLSIPAEITCLCPHHSSLYILAMITSLHWTSFLVDCKWEQSIYPESIQSSTVRTVIEYPKSTQSSTHLRYKERGGFVEWLPSSHWVNRVVFSWLSN